MSDNNDKVRFWLARGERVMNAHTYECGTIVDSVGWQHTGTVTVKWDNDLTTTITKFDLEPIFVEGH